MLMHYFLMQAGGPGNEHLKNVWGFTLPLWSYWMHLRLSLWVYNPPKFGQLNLLGSSCVQPTEFELTRWLSPRRSVTERTGRNSLRKDVGKGKCWTHKPVNVTKSQAADIADVIWGVMQQAEKQFGNKLVVPIIYYQDLSHPLTRNHITCTLGQDTHLTNSKLPNLLWGYVWLFKKLQGPPTKKSCGKPGQYIHTRGLKPPTKWPSQN